jgi:excisionase family DNA binding protein
MALLDQQTLPFPASHRRVAALPTNATLTIPEAAKLLGIGRNLAYEIARRDGELAGVPVIRVGRRLLIPYARLLTVLGIDDKRTPTDPHE